ncbi:putative multi-protein-binding factor 1 [Yarrowia sp. B02]|nr:putative multi-protein-binding factor 1 [Yarrowia sp. B02]
MSDDWESKTVIGSRARVGGGGPRATVAKTQSEINAAMRSGNVLSTDKKYASANSKDGGDGQRLTKIDRSDDIIAPPKVEASVGKAIIKGRSDKGLTQKELAVKINEKPQVVNDYESGRAQPNQQVLSKMERALGIKLRGKDIGLPLGPKGKK